MGSAKKRCSLVAVGPASDSASAYAEVREELVVHFDLTDDLGDAKGPIDEVPFVTRAICDSTSPHFEQPSHNETEVSLTLRL